MDAIQEFYAALLDSQEPRDAEFDSVIYPNLWELYATDDEDQPAYWGA